MLCFHAQGEDATTTCISLRALAHCNKLFLIFEQIQGDMHTSGEKKAFFIVWLVNDFLIIQIQ